MKIKWVLILLFLSSSAWAAPGGVYPDCESWLKDSDNADKKVELYLEKKDPATALSWNTVMGDTQQSFQLCQLRNQQNELAERIRALELKTTNKQILKEYIGKDGKKWVVMSNGQIMPEPF